MNNLIEKFKIYGPKTFFKFIFFELYNRFFMRYIKQSYSQLGEDLIIDRLLTYKKRGTYVDIGAYDPDRFSNTKRFYLKGWSGINIEPNVENFNQFVDKRSRDINLNIGIGNTNEKLTFYSFIPDTLSTFSKTEAKLYQKQGFRLLSKKKVPVCKLSDILQKYLENTKIDFMSIDTEGFEMEVLKSNDWKKFRPKYICIELSHDNMTQKEYQEKADMEKFLLKKQYIFVSSTQVNSLFKDSA